MLCVGSTNRLGLDEINKERLALNKFNIDIQLQQQQQQQQQSPTVNNINSFTKTNILQFVIGKETQTHNHIIINNINNSRLSIFTSLHITSTTVRIYVYLQYACVCLQYITT